MARYKYTLLLGTFVMLLVGVPLAAQTVGVSLLPLLTILMILACTHVVMHLAPRLAPLALPLAGLIIAANTLAWLHVPLVATVQMAAHLASAVFLFLTIGVVLADVFRQPGVSGDGLCAALSGYLVLGTAFGHLLAAAFLAWPDSFTGRSAQQLAALDAHRQQMLLTYVSFQALTTMGFSDLEPAGLAMRGLVVVTTVLGQFYLAVLVADLVGKRLGQRSIRSNGEE